MKAAMPRLVYGVLRNQRYGCLRCGWCCRGWRIQVTPEERDSLLAHDWAAHSPRLRNARLFEEEQPPGRRDPAIHIALEAGRCIFLETDGLCLIHRTLGPEAKPGVCRGFPVLVDRTVDGILVGAHYSCLAMVRNHGEPFSRMEQSILERLDRMRAAPAPDRGTRRRGTLDPEPTLAPGISLTWTAYLALEESVLRLLFRASRPARLRMAVAGQMVSAMADDWRNRSSVTLGEGQVAAWLASWKRNRRERVFEHAAGVASGPPQRRWRKLAPTLARVEAPEGTRKGHEFESFVSALAHLSGSVILTTLPGLVDLAAMARVRYDPDAPEFDDYLTRFLANYVLRKSLLDSPSVKAGCRRLSDRLDLVGWYAAASAAMGGRQEVEPKDVVTGIQAVEKAYCL